MSITKQAKQELIKNFGKNEQDTGSTEVQCAVMTTRIQNLTEHLKTHKKDHSSRRGLLILVNRRKRMLEYLKSNDEAAYNNLIKKLNLRK